MLTYPQFDPVAFSIGNFKVHWYGLMYLGGFLAAWCLCRWRTRASHVLFTKTQVDEIIFYAAMGVILGGRIGYMVFYDFSDLLANPLILFKVWEGGMSFHGGLIGVMLALGLLVRKFKCSYWDLTDFVIPVVPIGLGLGRIGNFINDELWGRVSDVPWAMVFPTGGPLARHPSQLYEALGEGVLLFVCLWIYSAKPRPRMAVSGWFLVGYSVMRIGFELFRQPDVQFGFIAFDWLTMGQLLSLPMFIFGGVLLWLAYKK